MTEPKRKIRILVADDQQLFREALSCLLNNEEGLCCVGEAGSGELAVEAARSLAPDVVLLNPGMDGDDGVETLRALVALPGKPRIILVENSAGTNGSIEALRLGAYGVLPRDSAPQMLFKSLRAVAAGEYWVCRRSICDLIECFRASGAPAGATVPSNGHHLTPREVDVVASVMDGCTNRDIADKLAISDQTVKRHLTSIFDKMGVRNRLELVLFASRRPAH